MFPPFSKIRPIFPGSWLLVVNIKLIKLYIFTISIKPILLEYSLVSKFRFLEFQLFLDQVTPYLQSVNTNCLITVVISHFSCLHHNFAFNLLYSSLLASWSLLFVQLYLSLFQSVVNCKIRKIWKNCTFLHQKTRKHFSFSLSWNNIVLSNISWLQIHQLKILALARIENWKFHRL